MVVRQQCILQLQHLWSGSHERNFELISIKNGDRSAVAVFKSSAEFSQSYRTVKCPECRNSRFAFYAADDFWVSAAMPELHSPISSLHLRESPLANNRTRSVAGGLEDARHTYVRCLEYDGFDVALIIEALATGPRARLA